MGDPSGKNTKPNNSTTRIIGILAHVDAGKTTLSEAMLYTAGSIRKPGRVDHKDAFLDTFQLEKNRGITIFSKQAELEYKGMKVMLLDTPGHVDFSTEMERTLQVLDYAILVISGKDGVQGHTGTLFQLLKKYEIPTFLFINKMDLEGAEKHAVLDELQQVLDPGCIDFSQSRTFLHGTDPEWKTGADGDETAEYHGDNSTLVKEKDAEPFRTDWMEQLAMCREPLLEMFLETGSVTETAVIEAIEAQCVFPCYFGAALKMQGVEAFLDGLRQYSRGKSYPEQFGARIYKIARDPQGSRLTYLKVTGGSLAVKDLLTNQNAADASGAAGSGGKADAPIGKREAVWEEKVDQIRIYSGAKYRTAECVAAGQVCAVTGLSKTFPGQGLGIETEGLQPVLEPVLIYGIVLPEGCDVHRTFLKLKELEEEDPLLKIVWSEHLQELHIRVMGEIQLEILQNLIAERFGLSVTFSAGRIAYKETITEAVVGAGHFEPLRHYAEVHLLLEPGEPGSGILLDTRCSEDQLDRNWQRLILTHLAEREHTGVLAGAPITDMKITLLAGRAHLKHTEGGDFRQATYRAVRQGLKKAERAGAAVLLEPWYAFRLEVPMELLGRAMADIKQMSGTFSPPQTIGSMAKIEGTAPVAAMKNYMTEVHSYTKGRGRLFCSLGGYAPCHDREEVIASIGYDSDRDTANPADSVFCSHGAGVNVRWDQVEEHLHVDSGWMPPGQPSGDVQKQTGGIGRAAAVYGGSAAEDAELEQIFRQTYGESKRREQIYGTRMEAKPEKVTILPTEVRDAYLLVDGYNIIFAWKELKELAKVNLDAARQALIEILCNYQGFTKCRVVAVFDAYRVSGGERKVEKYGGIDVVYTKEAETADMYIEKVTYEIGKAYYVRVATSDHLQQMIIIGNGAYKVSAEDFKREVEQAEAQISAILEEYNRKSRIEGRSTIKIPKPL